MHRSSSLLSDDMLHFLSYVAANWQFMLLFSLVDRGCSSTTVHTFLVKFLRLSTYFRPTFRWVEHSYLSSATMFGDCQVLSSMGGTGAGEPLFSLPTSMFGSANLNFLANMPFQSQAMFSTLIPVSLVFFSSSSNAEDRSFYISLLISVSFSVVSFSRSYSLGHFCLLRRKRWPVPSKARRKK